jgi:uncharacterized protein (DUF58 family)
MADSAELIKKIRKIEIKSRGLSNQIFSGEYHSAFKGRGMTFSEVREYQPGDDIRTIDWNVTARFNHPFVKVFEEEREMTVMLLIDISASQKFGTTTQLKKDLITELCATLAFSAIQNNDKIGVIFFTDIIEKFIPPKKGRSHILRIIRELLNFEPQHRNTDISQALRYFTNMIRKRSTAFLVSDFMTAGFEQSLKIAARKHDLIALRVTDKREKELPDVGLIKVHDNETGESRWLDTSDEAVRSVYSVRTREHEDWLRYVFNRSGVDTASIITGQSYVQPLMTLFKRREGKP